MRCVYVRKKRKAKNRTEARAILVRLRISKIAETSLESGTKI